MGNQKSLNVAELGDNFPKTEKFYGLQNMGNSCCITAVLQALYACPIFRFHVLQYQQQRRMQLQSLKDRSMGTLDMEPDLISALAELFTEISKAKQRCGFIVPKNFLDTLRRYPRFRQAEQYDALEVLNFLLQSFIRTLSQQQSQLMQGPDGVQKPESDEGTWIHQIFQGKLSNEMQCLQCESTTSRDQKFLHLSLDIEPNSSLSHCLRLFSTSEILYGASKQQCESCQCRQEAYQCAKVKQLPVVLVLHLNRFTYLEKNNARYTRKLDYRVAFPTQLKLTNTLEETKDREKSYNLFAVIIHIGSGIKTGRYVTMVRNHDRWFLYDDHVVQLLQDDDVMKAFGSGISDPDSAVAPQSQSAYILLYQRSQ